MFCLVFALLGIPLNLMVLKHIGDKIHEFIHWCHYKIETKICKRDVNVLKTKTLLWSAAVMVVLLLLGGVLYSQTEQWSFLDSVYYCFVTFSTIGFGDLVPNQGKDLKCFVLKEKLISLRYVYNKHDIILIKFAVIVIDNFPFDVNIFFYKYCNRSFSNFKLTLTAKTTNSICSLSLNMEFYSPKWQLVLHYLQNCVYCRRCDFSLSFTSIFEYLTTKRG